MCCRIFCAQTNEWVLRSCWKLWNCCNYEMCFTCTMILVNDHLVLCNESLSSAQVPALTQIHLLLPAVGWHASALRHSPRHHRVSACCCHVVSCLLAAKRRQPAAKCHPDSSQTSCDALDSSPLIAAPQWCYLNIDATLYSHDPRYSRIPGAVVQARDTATIQALIQPFVSGGVWNCRGTIEWPSRSL